MRKKECFEYIMNCLKRILIMMKDLEVIHIIDIIIQRCTVYMVRQNLFLFLNRIYKAVKDFNKHYN